MQKCIPEFNKKSKFVYAYYTSVMAKEVIKKSKLPGLEKPLADVFISYARKDAHIAANLARLLRDEGFEVWFDEKIYAGANWE